MLVLAASNLTNGAAMKKSAIPGLSKSRYLNGLQCPKYLWLATWRKELRNEFDETTEEILAQGHQVGALAQELFPGGVEIPYEGLSIDEQLQKHRKRSSRARSSTRPLLSTMVSLSRQTSCVRCVGVGSCMRLKVLKR
jgi:hypothetical protein